MAGNNSLRGFTLLEMLIVVVITVILTTIAAPGLVQMVKDNRLVSTSSDLIADLAIARGEAAKRGVRVTICVSEDGSSCSNSTNWALGRIVFVESNAGGTMGTVDTGETIVRASSGLGGSLTLSSSGFTNNNYILFLPTGASGSAGSFTLCDDRSGAFGRLISVSVTGRVSLTKGQSC